MGSESSKSEKFIDDAEDVVKSLRSVSNLLSDGNLRSEPSFIKDAEDVVKTIKFVNNVSRLLSREGRVQSAQRRQAEQPSTSRGTQQRSHYNPVPDPAPNLERTRTPYSFSNRDLDNNIREANSRRLYPNLDNERRNFSPQRINSPVTVVDSENQRQNNSFTSELSARSDEDFVVLNQYQPRAHFIPSAPSAADVMWLPDTASASKPSKPAQPRCGPSNPGPSNVPHSIFAQKAPRSRSVSRNRALDPRFYCQTCAKRYGLTIYNCVKGHGACKDCKDDYRMCGSENGCCNAPITEMRNIALEAYVAQMGQLQLTKCQNAKCTRKFNIHDMEKHLKECPFGTFDCPMGTLFGKCSARCKVENLAFHFDAHHKEQRVDDPGQEMFLFNMTKDTHKLYLNKIGPYNFLIHAKISEKDSMIYLAVQLLGSAESCSKWTYEFHVYNKNQPLRKYHFSHNCQSFSTPLSDILAESKCATLPFSYAMSFENKGVITYKYYIKKTTENPRRRRKNDWKSRNSEN